MKIQFEIDAYGEVVERWESAYKGQQVVDDKGTVCTIEGEFFYNGETWFTLRKENGEVIESPTIFWDFI